MKCVLIAGVTCQDGPYVFERLLEEGQQVEGIKRRSSSQNTERIDYICKDSPFHSNRFYMHYSDLSDSSNLTHIIKQVQLEESYNLAVRSGSYQCEDNIERLDGLYGHC